MGKMRSIFSHSQQKPVLYEMNLFKNARVSEENEMYNMYLYVQLYEFSLFTNDLSLLRLTSSKNHTVGDTTY